MFEEWSFEAILQRMLDRVSNETDKREGSVVYDMLAPLAVELAEHYSVLADTLDLLYPETACGEWLDRLGGQFGLPRKEAKAAKRRLVIEGNDGESLSVPVGSRFSGNGLVWQVERAMEDGGYLAVCETAGESGNTASGTLTPLGYLTGLRSVVADRVVEAGCERENDETYRQRIKSAALAPAFGGNCADYMKQATGIPGVGHAHIFPAYKGGGSVGIVIDGSDGKAVDDALIKQVQDVFSGDEGTAPIGHAVLVKSCVEKKIDLKMAVTLEDGAALTDVRSALTDAIRQELAECGFDEGQVYLAKVAAAALKADGVKDVPLSALFLNGVQRNVSMSKSFDRFEIPVFGTLNVTEAA